ncbi:hypothetical protein DK254_02415 [Pseudomonas sp. RW407]|uniref:DUF2523 family protein n=1 Tax=Pseudomonas sp. RW407 TaxID=2202894 RepID=UPI000D6EFDF2|nr:DUF2523 family protein [Pseudomonas sp. RW407]PWU31377.1 hypothetical protein DK254_02415 [Pseudomonas sp. RW407]
MWGVLVQALIAAVGYLLPRLLAALGVVVVSETAVKPILDWLHNKIITQMSGLPEQGLHLFQYMGFEDAIGIVFSAYGVLLGLQAAKAAFSKSASKGQ